MDSVRHRVTSEDHIQLEHRASDIHTQQETKVTVTGIGEYLQIWIPVGPQDKYHRRKGTTGFKGAIFENFSF